MELLLLLPQTENGRIADEMNRIRLNLTWTKERFREFKKENQELIARIDSLERHIYQQFDTSLLDDKEVLDLPIYGHHVIKAGDSIALILAMAELQWLYPRLEVRIGGRDDRKLWLKWYSLDWEGTCCDKLVATFYIVSKALWSPSIEDTVPELSICTIEPRRIRQNGKELWTCTIETRNRLVRSDFEAKMAEKAKRKVEHRRNDDKASGLDGEETSRTAEGTEIISLLSDDEE